MNRAICVYCGSAAGARPVYAEAAQAFAAALVGAGMSLVYGGGRVGLMGILADAVLAAGGQAVGVIPRLLMEREVGHRGLTELHVVDDMHQRKRMMADLADGFVTLPGGAGTLEELFEIYTWAQLGYHAKPIGLLNVAGYYDPLLALLRHTVAEGFMRPGVIELLQVASEPATLLAQCARYVPPVTDKWAEKRDAV